MSLAESILMSLPSLTRWQYGYKTKADIPEAELTNLFLKRQDWVHWVPTTHTLMG